MTRALIGTICWLALSLSPALLRAENEGQGDLDKATELQLKADNLNDLEKVVDLCESALSKGLDDDNAKFAKQLLTSTLYEHAARLAGALFNVNKIIDPQHQRHPQWPLVRNLAIKDLEKSLAVEDQQPAAHLLLARLYGMNPMEADKARASADKAVAQFKEDEDQLSMALIVRGALRKDLDEQLADFDAAVKAAPGSHDALRMRALHYLGRKDFAKAAEDFQTILEKNPENTSALGDLAETLTADKQFDEAIALIDRIIAAKPEASAGYTARARVKALQEKVDDALEDLNLALEKEPKDVTALMIRASIHSQKKDFDKAKADLDAALKIRPNMVQGLLMQAELAAREGNYAQALETMRLMAGADPMNPLWKVQIAQLLAADKRPRQAIEAANEVLKGDPANSMALRIRGDSYLSIGRHKEAIADLEAALEQDPENSGLLNNLAWVLATSPEDDLRNGKRAIELATKACDVTEFKRPHIISTLAAAYAETGDFENAIKWSTKAVEMSGADDETADPDTRAQLKKELEGYKNEQPFREKQETPEKEDKPKPSREDLEI